MRAPAGIIDGQFRGKWQKTKLSGRKAGGWWLLVAAVGCCWLDAGRDGERELEVILDAQTEGLLIKPWCGPAGV